MFSLSRLKGETEEDLREGFEGLGEVVEVEVNGRRRVLSWFDALEI